VATLADYVGVDASFELLQYAIGRISTSSTLVHGFGLVALWADFTETIRLPPKPPSAVSLILLTGFTFGNHRESTLIRSISRIVEADDFLFLDARLHPLPALPAVDLTEEQREVVLKGYVADSIDAFAFGPVEMVTTSTAAEVEFGHEVNQNTTCVANAFNVIKYCRDLRTHMRLDGQPITVPRLDLTRGTTYRYENLIEWFPTAGLEVVWTARADDIGFFLLRRASRP
jgi:hypothetical protein